MNAKQESKFAMYRTVEHHLDTNSSIIAVVPALAAAITDFKAVITNIAGTTQLKDVNLSGITVDKSVLKQALAQKAADIAGFIYAYASTINNNTLLQEVDYNLSKLLKTRDEQLAPRCQIIQDRGTENLSALKAYGVTDDKLNDLQQAISNYVAASPKPRNAVNNRKTLKSNLAELFKQGDFILKKRIDRLVNNFRESHPDFARTYKSARTIIDAATTPTQLKGLVTDAADNKPLKDATVTIVELGKTAKTDTAGEYSFKPVEHGTYTVKVTKDGYQPFEADETEIKLGDIRHLNVNLINS